MQRFRSLWLNFLHFLGRKLSAVHGRTSSNSQETEPFIIPPYHLSQLVRIIQTSRGLLAGASCHRNSHIYREATTPSSELQQVHVQYYFRNRLYYKTLAIRYAMSRVLLNRRLLFSNTTLDKHFKQLDISHCFFSQSSENLASQSKFIYIRFV